jgi:hypothetical protein
MFLKCWFSQLIQKEGEKFNNKTLWGLCVSIQQCPMKYYYYMDEVMGPNWRDLLDKVEEEDEIEEKIEEKDEVNNS